MRFGIAAIAAGLALAGAPALAQEAPAPATNTPTETIGPRELEGFSLNGTVTRPAPAQPSRTAPGLVVDPRATARAPQTAPTPRSSRAAVTRSSPQRFGTEEFPPRTRFGPATSRRPPARPRVSAVRSAVTPVEDSRRSTWARCHGCWLCPARRGAGFLRVAATLPAGYAPRRPLRRLVPASLHRRPAAAARDSTAAAGLPTIGHRLDSARRLGLEIESRPALCRRGR